MDFPSQNNDDIEENDDWARDRAIPYQLKRLRRLRSALCIESLVLDEYKVVLDGKLNYETKDIVAVFEGFKRKKICHKNAKLYIKWAEFLVERGHTSKACLVLQSALGSKVEPADEIRNYLSVITPRLGPRPNSNAFNKLKDHMIGFGDSRTLNNHRPHHVSDMPHSHKRLFKFGRLNIGSSPVRVMASERDYHERYNAESLPRHLNEREHPTNYNKFNSLVNQFFSLENQFSSLDNQFSSLDNKPPSLDSQHNFDNAFLQKKDSQGSCDSNSGVDMELEMSEAPSYGKKEQKSSTTYQNISIPTEAIDSEFDIDFKDGSVNNNYIHSKNTKVPNTLISERNSVCVASTSKVSPLTSTPLVSNDKDILYPITSQKSPPSSPLPQDVAYDKNKLIDTKPNISSQKIVPGISSTIPVGVSDPCSIEKKKSQSNIIDKQNFYRPLLRNVCPVHSPQSVEVQQNIDLVQCVDKNEHNVHYPEVGVQSQQGIPVSLNHQNPNDKLVNINNRSYRRVELIGRGGSSKVFKILSLDGKRFLALKKVDLRGADSVAVKGYLSEIEFLQRLKNHDKIINLIDHQISLQEGIINMVLEYGEIDLARLCYKYRNTVMSINSIRMYWEQMLNAVHAIHKENIIHSDLKPANFLLVEGNLKLIDFGIARAIPNDTTNIHRDYQTGTINYMAPEAISFTEKRNEINGNKSYIKLGRASDVWSLGCILYQMVYGKPPFAHLNTIIKKLQCIIDPSHQINFPVSISVDQKTLKKVQPSDPSSESVKPEDIKKNEIMVDPALIAAIKGCLARRPHYRMTIPQLLQHEFLNPSTHHHKSKLPGVLEDKSSIPVKIITEIIRETIITSVERINQNVYPTDLLSMSEKFVSLVVDQISNEEKISLSQFRNSLESSHSSGQ